jgi:hypothetical protein
MSVEALGNNFVKVSNGRGSFMTPEMVEKLAKLKGGNINFVPLKPINPVSKFLKVKHPALLMVSLGTLLSCGVASIVGNKLESSENADNLIKSKLVYLS